MEFRTIVNRTIHAVGQGGFYTEKIEFENNKYFYIVYDCGCRNIKKGERCSERIEKCIDEVFTRDEKIEAVFFSHFHQDHINGLEYLINRCNVQRVYVPVLTLETKTMMLLALDDEQESIHNYILNPSATIHQFEKGSEVEVIGIEENSPMLLYLTETGITMKKPTTGRYRQYIPFNINQNKSFNEIKKRIEEKGLELPSPEQLRDYSRLEEIKSIFSTYFKKGEDKNSNSLTLLSMCSISTLEWLRAICGCEIQLFNSKVNCLYLGDYNLNNDGVEKLQSSYGEYCDFVQTIQIPHHGSKDNFNESIFDAFPQCSFFFCSAGTKNTYGHPNNDVLLQCIRNGKTVHWVSEKKESELVLDFRLLEVRVIPE